MACHWKDPYTCVIAPVVHGAVNGTVSSTVPAAWASICKSFVSAASYMLETFARAFVKIPDVDPADPGISKAYAASLSVGALAAVILLFIQVIRTAWTHDGSPLAHGAAGIAKAVITWMATAAVATAALSASDNLTGWIVGKTFGSQKAFVTRLGDIVSWAAVAGQPGQAAADAAKASLGLVIALIGIVLLIVLWIEMLLRNTALAVLLAVSPISAAGQVSETTREWWQRLVSACVQLIILRPVIAIVFCVGFSMAGKSHGFESVLAGLLALGLAVFSWPVIARFFTFATIQSASSGLATVLGFAAGRLSGNGSSGGSGSGGPAGVEPSQWSRSAEQQTMASRGGGTGGEMPAAGPGGGTPGSGTPGGGGNGAAALAGIATVLSALHRAGTAASARMEQTAGHASMPGAYPYSSVGGSQRIAPPGQRRNQQAGPAAPGQDGGHAPDASAEPREREEAPPSSPPPGPPLGEPRIDDNDNDHNDNDPHDPADGGQQP